MPQATDTSTDHGQAYGDWVAPKYDGALLVWPEAASLPDTARENRKRLDAADHVRIGHKSLPQWRTMLRSSDALVVATGHQTELHHVGVWVKNVVAHATAEAVDGQAVHWAVDTDSPKHLTLKWPGFASPISQGENIASAAWTSRIEPADREHLASLL
ncbi:MAG: hypothetical protein AAGK78_16850, partial [Planctomycetota bacterium]